MKLAIGLAAVLLVVLGVFAAGVASGRTLKTECFIPDTGSLPVSTLDAKLAERGYELNDDESSVTVGAELESIAFLGKDDDGPALERYLEGLLQPSASRRLQCLERAFVD